MDAFSDSGQDIFYRVKVALQQHSQCLVSTPGRRPGAHADSAGCDSAAPPVWQCRIRTASFDLVDAHADDGGHE